MTLFRSISRHQRARQQGSASARPRILQHVGFRRPHPFSLSRPFLVVDFLSRNYFSCILAIIIPGRDVYHTNIDVQVVGAKQFDSKASNEKVR